jgi:hypothetical protein
MMRTVRTAAGLGLAVLGLAAMGLIGASARADVIDDALALSKKTGRPILAIAGSDT